MDHPVAHPPVPLPRMNLLFQAALSTMATAIVIVWVIVLVLVLVLVLVIGSQER